MSPSAKVFYYAQVEEAVTTSALLRLPPQMPRAEKRQRVADVIQQLVSFLFDARLSLLWMGLEDWGSLVFIIEQGLFQDLWNTHEDMLIISDAITLDTIPFCFPFYIALKLCIINIGVRVADITNKNLTSPKGWKGMFNSAQSHVNGIMVKKVLK